MECIVVTKTGRIDNKNLERRDLVHEFDVHLRDLRPVFSSKQLVTISPRGNSIVANLGVLKIVIGKSKVYIFNTANPVIEREFVPALVEALKVNEESIIFEFRVLETALHFRFTRLRDEFEKAEKVIGRSLSKVEKFLDEKSLEKLLHHKKELSKLNIAVEQIETEIDEILDDENEIEEFYLSITAPKNKDYEEIESVLENTSEMFEEIGNRIDVLKETIDNTQDFISLKLSNRRNLIIRFDLLATLITAVFSFLAVVTGAYGMNLINHSERSQTFFFWVIGFLVGFGLFSSLWIWWYLKKKKVF